MNRYLLHISYIGTHFKSFTKTKCGGEFVVPTTIDVIEEAMHALKPRNEVRVWTVSRTDSGVHALESAVVVDLERMNGKNYDCDYITSTLNRFFDDSSKQIRVTRTQMVPNTFNQHVNAVKSQTYLYRLGIMKPNLNIDYHLEEKERCYFMYSDKFDIRRLQEAAQMFVGRHDFRTFMSINNDAHYKPSYSLRRINYIKVERSHPHTIYPFQHEANVDYWDIILNAQSFLYRQVRRIVGASVTVAKGRLSQRELYEMLTIPSQKSFSNKITVVPANGLYLANIEFRPKCFEQEQDEIENISNDFQNSVLNEPKLKNKNEIDYNK